MKSNLTKDQRKLNRMTFLITDLLVNYIETYTLEWGSNNLTLCTHRENLDWQFIEPLSVIMIKNHCSWEILVREQQLIIKFYYNI
jgi:hypothetical protein